MTGKSPSILIISGVRGDTRRYRTIHLYEQARLAGLDCQLTHITDASLPKKAKNASIVFLHRAPFTPQIAWLAEEFRRKGGVLIQDIDDLLFEPEMFRYIHSVDFADPLRASLYKEEMQMYRQTVDACHVATTSTGFLAERVHRMGKPVYVHRNAFSFEMLALSAKACLSRRGMDERIVIGYASGTPTHDQDFALVKPALVSIMQKFANIELWLVGPVDPGKAWGSMGDRLHRYKKVPWRDLPALQAQFDINLAPLCTDNPFGQSKSEIKYMEAALVRVPTIASPSDAFKHAIRHNNNGILADSTTEWEHALERLYYERRTRREMGDIAYEDMLLRYHPHIRATELVGTLNAITGAQIALPTLEAPTGSAASDPDQSYWSSANVEKIPTLVQMARYTLRQRGWQVLLKQVRVYLRRWLSPLIPYRRSW